MKITADTLFIIVSVTIASMLVGLTVLVFLG